MSADSNVADEIRARRLIIEDAEGNSKIILGTTPEGHPGIGLRDQNGVIRMQLIVLDGNSPKVLLTDSAGNGRVQVMVDEHDSAGISIFHDNDRPWLLFTTDGHRNYIMCLF